MTTNATEARALTNAYLQWTKLTVGRPHSTLSYLYQRIRQESMKGFSNVVGRNWELSDADRQELARQGYRLFIVDGAVVRIDW